MKSALITFGNEESYGLLFVSGELKRFSQERKFFDGEEEDVLERILEWKPDFVMFSPMTTFYERALNLMLTIRTNLPQSVSVIGGHHAMATSGETIKDGFDICVAGPVRGSIGKILDGERGLIKVKPTEPSDLPFPDREKYYEDVPRMRDRYRKFVLSMLGCPWNCSYCSSSCGHMREIFGLEDHKRYYLKRRPIDDVMDELHEVIKYPTKEIEWVDDDVFACNDDRWVNEFVTRYNCEINLPMYISTTSCSVLRVSDYMLREFSRITSAVGLGVQAARAESLRLFNRQWDDEGRMQAAYDRLVDHGFNVNLQAIVGLPVEDPVEDALDTLRLMQRIGQGSICSVYPLQVYPGTKLEKYCRDQGILLRSQAKGDTNTGETGIWFDERTTKRLRNICKLATMFVKFGVDENWMRALIDVDFDDETSKELSVVRYHDCVIDRLRDESVFEDIMNTTKLRY